jgi:rRNA-processing protein FCF1
MPETYLGRLLTELDDFQGAYLGVLADSTIENVDPNRHGSGMAFIGFAKWGWATSNDQLESRRMALMQQVGDWEPRFRLLFPNPTPSVTKRLKTNLSHIKRWLERSGKPPHDIPPTIAQAQDKFKATIADLRQLADLLSPDDYAIRLVVDTNALIDNPDLSAYTDALGGRYVVHLLPVVLRELDDLKRAGRNETVREGAKAAERRLKGIRNNGDVRQGVRVAGDVVAKFEHIEPSADGLPGWLDLTVPDDRLVASSLLLQSAHPGSAFYIATSDINLQTKLAAIGLPYVEPPSPK